MTPQLSPDRLRYAFTHSLLQEAARSTLLRERRQELHGLVAQAIETLDPKTAAEHPELLAQHFAEAGMFGRAADCWLAAGLNVAKTWAKVEAANMFAMGLACLERLPPSRERSEKSLSGLSWSEGMSCMPRSDTLHLKEVQRTETQCVLARNSATRRP